MFDAHCHFDFDAFDQDREAVWRRAREAGVRALHIPGVAPTQWSAAAKLGATDPAFGFGVGLHPWWLAELDHAQRQLALDKLAAASRGAEAIGECGLDGGLCKHKGVAYAVQLEVLDAHLEVARARDLPVVLHVLGAHGRALKRLRHHGPLAAGGMLHSYSGPPEMVPAYAALGLSFSFSAAVARPGAKRPLAAVRAVPEERLLLESDGPDQPIEGEERGGPDQIPAICRAVAAARSIPADAVAATTWANAQRLFRRDAVDSGADS